MDFVIWWVIWDQDTNNEKEENDDLIVYLLIVFIVKIACIYEWDIKENLIWRGAMQPKKVQYNLFNSEFNV